MKVKEKVKNISNKYIYWFFLVYSFVIRFFTSHYSIRFDKSVFIHDGAIFYSVGRMIMNGKILYKEVFDNKTPYLHLIYGIGSLLKERHLGLFIIDIILFYIVIIYIYKILKLFNYKYSLFVVLLSTLFLSNPFLTQGIIKTETCALAVFVPAIYIFAKYFNTYEPDFKLKDIYVIGLLAGFSFMTNIRAIVLFVPFGLVVAFRLIINKKYKNLFLIFVSGLFGVFTLILPYIIYAFITDSFTDFYESVILNNFAYNAIVAESFKLRIISILGFLKSYWWYILYAIYSFVCIFFLKFNKYFKISILLSYIVGIYYLFFTGSNYLYNLVILIPFYVFGVVVFVNILSMIFKKLFFLNEEKIDLKNIIETIIILLIAICPYSIHMSIYAKNCISRSNRLIAEIKNVGIDIKKAKVLSFGFNPLIYTYLDIIPQFKYFYGPSISYKLAPAQAEGQVNYIVNKEPDIIIMHAGINDDKPTIPSNFEYSHGMNVTLSMRENYHLVCRYRMNEEDGSYLVFARNDYK